MKKHIIAAVVAITLGVGFITTAATAGAETASTGCLPAGKTGTVLRTRTDHNANSRDQVIAMAVRLKSGTVLTCVGGEPNSVIRAGDVIDGRSLSLYGAAR
jgi:hypothetical protein